MAGPSAGRTTRQLILSPLLARVCKVSPGPSRSGSKPNQNPTLPRGLEENLDVAIEVKEHVMQQKMEAVKGELTEMKGKLTKMEGKMNARESSVEQRENEIAEREEKLAAKQRDLEEWKEEASSRLREDRVIVNQVSFFCLHPAPGHHHAHFSSVPDFAY